MRGDGAGIAPEPGQGMRAEKEILILGAEVEALQAALTLAALGRRVVLATRGREFPPPRPKAGPEEERERRILALRAAFHPLIEMRTQSRLAGTRPAGEGPGQGAELIREPPGSCPSPAPTAASAWRSARWTWAGTGCPSCPWPGPR